MEPSEADYAASASISSNDSNFTASNEGGTIKFQTEGGQVAVIVDCGIDWTATATGDWIDTEVDYGAGTLTVTAGQNYVEEELSASISLATAASGIKFATITVTQTAYGVPTLTVESDEWHVPAIGELSTDIGVTASAEWEVENTAEWLIVEKTGEGISLTATENESTEERTAEVVVTCSDGYQSAYETISVTQDAKAYVTLSSNSISFSAEAGSESVTVESNYEWEYTTDADWITLSASGSELTVSVTESDSGETREAVVTVSAGDGAENIVDAQLSVSQLGKVYPLILTYTTTSDGTSITLPLGGMDGTEYTVDCTVDWGDGGDVETVTEGFPKHTYTTAGEYDVTITGTVTALCSKSIGGSSSNRKLLTGVKQWGNTGLTDMTYALYYSSNLTTLPGDTTGSFANVTTFERAFSYCGLTSVPEDLFAYCANVTSYAYVFYWINSSLTYVPDELFYNSPNVKTFEGAFNMCQKLSYIPEDLFSKCPEVESFSATFSTCSAVTQMPSGLFDNNLKVTDFSKVFSTCPPMFGESPYTVINGEKVHLYERLDHQDYFGVTEIVSTNAFLMCRNLTDYDDIPSGWK